MVLRSASGVPGPSSVTNLAYWWVASDLAVGSSVLSWTDRVQHAVWTNGNSATRPTNSLTGVCFNTTSELTNNFMDFSGPPWNGGGTWVAVLQPIAMPGLVSSVWIGGSDFGAGFTSAANVVNPNSFGAICKALLTVQDWIFPLAGGSFAFYTNNVQASSGAGLGNLFNRADMFKLASAPAGGTRGAFYLREFLIYTNVLATNSVNRATLHTYFTNTYSFAP